MNKIEDILENWFKKTYTEEECKNILNKNIMNLLKESFIAGYEQCIEDRRKITGS